MKRAAAKLTWYAYRLKAMGPEEIAHRIGEAARRRTAARRAYGWEAFAVPAGPLPALPMAHPISPGSVEAGDAGLLETWRTAARSLETGLELLGRRWPAGTAPDIWHLDPVTGRSWPREAFCFDIDFRSAEGMGDMKYAWERNRLQYLQPIAALAAATQDSTLAARCYAEIDSWIEANPPFRGLSWNSGIELALRTVSILAVTALCGTVGLAAGQGDRIRSCLAAHAAWLSRYPSLHSSANNHLIAEAGALLLIGTLCPDLPDAPRHADAGRRILVEEAFRQIHPDGVGAEQSPTYTAFTLEWYLLAARVAEATGQPLPPAVIERLTRAAEHLAWMTDEHGHQPRIGDDDEGRVLISAIGREPGYVTQILGALATRVGRPDLAVAASPPHLRSLFVGRAPASPAPAPEGTRSFDEGGYSALRRPIAGRRMLAVLDHGPVGHLSIAAHGHADALSLWLHLDGEPVLVDAGTYMYWSGGADRDRFRSSASHNALVLGDLSSSDPAGAFNWRRKAKAWRLEGTGPEIAARHDGFLSALGLLCERRLSASETGLVVVDRLVRARPSPSPVPPLRIGYLVDPRLQVRLEAGAAVVVRDGVALMRLSAPEELRVALEPGEVSPAFGERVPATRIVLSSARPLIEHDMVTRITVLPPAAQD